MNLVHFFSPSHPVALRLAIGMRACVSMMINSCYTKWGFPFQIFLFASSPVSREQKQKREEKKNDEKPFEIRSSFHIYRHESTFNIATARSTEIVKAKHFIKSMSYT